MAFNYLCYLPSFSLSRNFGCPAWSHISVCMAPGRGPSSPLLQDLPPQPCHIPSARPCHGTLASQPSPGSASAGPLPVVCVGGQCPAGPHRLSPGPASPGSKAPRFSIGCSLAEAPLKEQRKGLEKEEEALGRMLPFSRTSLGHKGQLGQEAVYNATLSGGHSAWS